MNMGALRAQEGRYAEALEYFRPAYARDPKFAELGKNFSRALSLEAAEQKKAGHRLEAMALYQEALAVMPGDAEVRRQLDTLRAEATGTSSPAGR
jgi:tetratricopeptide (TPR) repeat protein